MIKKVNKTVGRKYFVRTGAISLDLLLPFLTIIFIGVLLVYSAKMYMTTTDEGGNFRAFITQTVLVIGGLGISFFISKMDYKKYLNDRNVWSLYLFTLVLLVAVFAFPAVKGAKRWILLGPMTFQPSEFAKWTAVVFTAYFSTTRKNILSKRNTMFFFLNPDFAKTIVIPMGLMWGLILIEPSFTISLVFLLIVFYALLYSGIDFRVLSPYVLTGMVMLIFFLIFESWRLDRILAWTGQGFQNHQITQSMIAFGSGGIWGKGIGRGVQKLLFLSEVENDFIFANVGEELGLWGCLLLVFLYVWFMRSCFRISTRVTDPFDKIYSATVASLITTQTLINMLVATGGMPVTGVTLPFISSGGSSSLVMFIMIGPILGMSREINERSERRRKRK
ncbi:MAG: FtsW/RodA/SpoVE family cell cycle protein [Eubacteriaceae bacterium]|jgi:cell division protein FtsW|nr:FtsW/RodA/SpoVE family cell cycle protein [Eubacteriaceae bacterium]